MRVEHGFGPVWDAGSRVLVLGSVPSPKSREMRFYYGHPRNRFWPVMAAVFHDDGCLRECRDPDQIVGLRRDFALRHHMALWDVIESCDIDGASDASIRNAVPNDLSPIIMRSKIAHVFTTGAKAAQLYRKLCVPLLRAHGLDGMPMTQLPSTSPANAKADPARTRRSVRMRRTLRFAGVVRRFRRLRHCPNPIYTIAVALKSEASSTNPSGMDVSRENQQNGRRKMALSAAIILAAGEGTRMRSNKPKVLHTLAGKTFLNRVMDSVAALDPDTLAVVVHYQAERVAEAARSYNEHVTIVEQDDIPGTGRAVQCAMAQLTQKDDLDGAVLIAASDMPLLDTDTLDQLLAFHEKSGNGATVLTTILDDPTGYGRIIRDSEGNVLRIVEQKDANSSELAVREVNTSVYVFDAKLLAEAIANLKSNNAQGEFYLTDALEAAKANGAVGAFAAPDPLSVEGINDRVQLAALAKAHNKRVCEHWMREGVTILDPDTTWIEDDVQIARDAVILPGCFLQGHTVIGEAAEVGPYTTLIGATIDAEAHVERSRVQETHIGRAANIGPWTYLRPGNELGEGSKAGAFVEMKKAHIGNGTKVPHLSYVGDADLGEHTNIGGGTITANYDGVHKHHTTIGSNVHVGAGNLFVAPVTVGDGVTTGAGSVVRHDVPSDSMVYSENTQHVVEGWKPEWER